MKISAFPNQMKLPATDAPFEVRFSEKAASAEDLSIGTSKTAKTNASGSTSVAPSDGITVEMIGCAAVVNCQVLDEARLAPAVSRAPVPMVAV